MVTKNIALVTRMSYPGSAGDDVRDRDRYRVSDDVFDRNRVRNRVCDDDARDRVHDNHAPLNTRTLDING